LLDTASFLDELAPAVGLLLFTTATVRSSSLVKRGCLSHSCGIPRNYLPFHRPRPRAHDSVHHLQPEHWYWTWQSLTGQTVHHIAGDSPFTSSATPRTCRILHRACFTVFLINADTLAADTCSDGHPIWTMREVLRGVFFHMNSRAEIFDCRILLGTGR
jgi:hypothetical protein